jgi:hypothetical protein
MGCAAKKNDTPEKRESSDGSYLSTGNGKEFIYAEQIDITKPMMNRHKSNMPYPLGIRHGHIPP